MAQSLLPAMYMRYSTFKKLLPKGHGMQIPHSKILETVYIFGTVRWINGPKW